MKYYKGILATTHVDKHKDKMTIEALKSIIEQANLHYIPVGIEHDPRTPPVGRVKSAELKELKDGEYAIEGVIEVFEDGDIIELQKDDPKSMKIREHSFSSLDISYDRNYQDEEDRILISEINHLLKSNTEPLSDIKKSLDPISIITIGGAFALGGIATGFLGKIGSDGWDLLKEKLKKLFRKRKGGKKEKLLSFEFDIEKEGYLICAQIIITNPKDQDIEDFLEYGLKKVDKVLPKYFTPELGIKRIVMEYSNNETKVKFGVRKDAVPINFTKLNANQ